MKIITTTELKEKIDNKEPIMHIDVRELNEYKEYNIGGTLISLSKIMVMDLDEIEEYKNQEIIVYCKSGKRSVQACLMLEEAGFTTTNVIGGLDSYKLL